MPSTIAYVSLGSNLGDRRGFLDSAISLLNETAGIERVVPSRFIETAPVGGPAGQGTFLNAAARLETKLGPRELFVRLRQIEEQLGRVRDVRWQARILDLDLILYGERFVSDPDLIVPHPRFSLRPFVLEPLAEVGADAIDPFTGQTISQLLDHVKRYPRRLSLLGDSNPSCPWHAMLRPRLNPLGWDVQIGFLSDPTYYLCIEPASVEDTRAGMLPLDRWQRLVTRLAPGQISPRPPAPVDWVATELSLGAVDEVVAICGGIS